MDKLRQSFTKGFQFIFALNISPLLFMVLLSWAFLLAILERAGQVMVSYEMPIIFIFGSITLLLQYVIINKIKPYCKSANIYDYIITLFLVVNFFVFYLSNYDKYFLSPPVWQAMILLIAAGLFYGIIKYNKTWIFLIVLSMAYSFFFAGASLGATAILDRIMGNIKVADSRMPAPLPENYIAQDFVKKPNIYLLSFDALMPKNVAQKLLKLEPEETLKYFDVLQKNDMQIIPNAFSIHPWTRMSFSSMLALDVAWHTKLYGEVTGDPYEYARKTGADMLAGAQWNPTYDIFDRNGYELRPIYLDHDFNNNNINKKVKTGYKKIEDGFCEIFDNIYSLWGYCAIRAALIGNGKDVYSDIFVEHIEAAATSQTPVLLHAYVWLPGHTGGYTASYTSKYDVNNKTHFDGYKKQFIKRGAEVAELLQKYLDAIIKNDEDAIILVFGDHGAHITKGAETGEGNSHYTKTDIMQDKHAVVLAVHDPHDCQIAEPVVTTLPDMMHNLITCLTGGKPVLKERYDSEAEFGDYLYGPVSSQ